MLGVRVGGVSAIEVEGSQGEACSAFPRAPPKKQTNPESFLKAIGQGLEHLFVLNLFHVKGVVDQEIALHKRRACAAVSAIHTGMHVQLFITMREC